LFFAPWGTLRLVASASDDWDGNAAPPSVRSVGADIVKCAWLRACRVHHSKRRRGACAEPAQSWYRRARSRKRDWRRN